ncbi:MAG: ribose-phosphate diphosphokinase [Spirochaetota bacterium]
MEDLKVFMGSSNRPLGREICEHIGIAPGRLSITRFANDNIFVQIEESVRGKDCFVVQSLYPDPNEALVELMIIVDALRSASARRITAVIPHYSYARSDKKDQPRISIAARLFADTLVTAGAMRFMLMNLHSEQVRGFFTVPADHLLSEPIITEYLSENFDLSNTVALLDLGQQKREGNFFRRLGLPLAIINKERRSDQEVEITHMIGDVDGKDVLMFEDEICRGTSLVAAARAVRQRGAKRIRVACTHGLFCDPATELIRESDIEAIVTTDSVHIPEERMLPNITVLSVGSLFGEAIRRTHFGESVSVLFK